jgi:PST family polysaccharide transporter
MILQSNYYFQATEKNIKLSVIIFIARVSTCILIYVFIKEAGSSLLTISFLAGSFLVSGLVSICYVIYSLGIKKDYFKFDSIMSELKKGRAIFVGNFSVSLFRGSNILILSVVSNPLAVSMYSLAEKIVKSLQALSRPLNELAFPKIVIGINSSIAKSDASKIIWDNTRHQILIMLFLNPMFIGGLHVILYLNVWDKLDIHIVNLITIMSFAIFFGIANFMYGSVGLNVLGFHRYYALAISAAGTITLITSITLSYAFHDVGASVSFLIGEALLFTFFYAKYRRLRDVSL